MKISGVNMNDIILKNEVKLTSLIYEIRGKQVMLDSDLARLYGCANGTKAINLAVKRHINRFPERFMFQLTKEEYCDLKFQSETSSWDGYGGVRKLPYAFTEQGVAMLATVLRTEVAEEVSIKIMDAFVAMRKYIASNTLETRVSNIETKLIDYDHKFELIFDKMDNEKPYHLFFNGAIYDAYSLLCDILSQAQESIVIIDNYLDKNILDVFASIQKDVLIVTKNINKKDLEMYERQYQNVKIIKNDSFHDRFIIIDKKTLYHCGASFKDLGKKCFAITKIKDNEILKNLLDKIEEL